MALMIAAGRTRTALALCVAASLGLSTAGCGDDDVPARVGAERRAAPDPARAERLAGARASVERLFRAVAERDCAAAAALLPRLTREEDCVELFREWQAHRMTLVEVLEVTPDGRDRTATIVRCRIERSGRVREALVRVTQVGDGWTVGL